MGGEGGGGGEGGHAGFGADLWVGVLCVVWCVLCVKQFAETIGKW